MVGQVFDLNREDLRKARAKAELKTENMVGLYIEYADEGGLSEEAEEAAARFVTGKASYSAARRAALDREIARRRELLD